MAKPMVAIVGRPNVGKSMLFNKLAGKRLSIVEDTPGVTRDRLYADCEWNGRVFTIVDTGGIEPRNDNEILQFMRDQAEIAIDNADVIVLVCDIRTGVTAADQDVANMLLRSKKPVVLAVNKADQVGPTDPEIYEFYNLGLGDPIAISAIHGLGVDEMLDECFQWFLDTRRECSFVGNLLNGVGDHVILLNALTKICSMAGLRLGYGIIPNAGLRERLEKFRQPWSVSAPAQAGGVAAFAVLAAHSEGNLLEWTVKSLQTERPRLAEKLEELGIRDYVVEIGGEVRAAGRKSEDVDGWNVGIVKPEGHYTENAYVLTVKNRAVATSGDYCNFYYDGGRKFSHTISPRTGYPVENGLASVTVFHDDCMTADALATALTAMGEKEALAFAEENGLAVILFVRDGSGIVPQFSSETKKMTGEK